MSDATEPSGRHTVIPAKDVRSIVWDANELVDIAGGNVRWGLDGNHKPRSINYAYRFDRAVVSPSDSHSAIYEVLGTKALLLRRDGKSTRELDRSFYHANAYEYPIALTQLTAREVVIHCPESYCRLEIEDADTGDILTRRETKSPDFFHSRLAVSPGGRYLLSAGWYWHPLGGVQVYDLEEALRRPAHLDEAGLIGWQAINCEIGAAAFFGDDRLVIAATDEESLRDEEPEQLLPNEIGVWSLPEARWLSRAKVNGPVGSIMPLDEHTCIGFYEHPKKIDLRTGEILAIWPEIESGKQLTAFALGTPTPPQLALDPARKRFAVACSGSIHIVEL